MANCCDSKVTLLGDNSDLKRLFEKLKGKDSIGLNEYPSLFNGDTDYTNFDWGSKRQTFDELDFTEEFGQDMYIYGYSDWNPAKGLWKEISKEYNLEIVLEYSEMGNNIGGVVSYVNGEVRYEDDMSYYGYLYRNDEYGFWSQIEMDLEDESLEDLIVSLGDVYEWLSDEERERISSFVN